MARNSKLFIVTRLPKSGISKTSVLVWSSARVCEKLGGYIPDIPLSQEKITESQARDYHGIIMGLQWDYNGIILGFSKIPTLG